MADTWWQKETELLIALWSEEAELSYSILGSFPCPSSHLKVKRGDDNHGTYAVGRRFVFNLRLRGYLA